MDTQADSTTTIEPIAAEPEHRFAAGDVLGGRYAILRFIAVGGMGEVYAAEDTVLRKRVALKTVRAHPARRDVALRRFWQEIRLAHQVTHPNVCRVFDVDFHDDVAFLTMELVEGESLRAWLAHGARGWREVRTRFIAAARGLAGAHRAGLVHRDFKPDNVLIGADGSVRVADFGLARLAGGDGADVAGGSDEPADGRGRDLTRDGAVAGTPAYMAPEIAAGEPANARSDQYSFAVSLRQALAGSDAPRWLRAVAARGCAPDPEDRYPSMDELLEALERVPQRRRLRLALAIGAAAITATAVLYATLARPPGDARLLACRGAGQLLDGAWDGARRRAALASLVTAGGPAAAVQVAESLQTLDRYAARLIVARRAACEAAVLGEVTPAISDLRAACLGLRRAALADLSDLLIGADDGILRSLGRAVTSLPDIDECADDRALLLPDPLPLDPVRAREVSQLRETLARARVLIDTEKVAEARALVAGVLPRAHALGNGQLEASALFSLALLEDAGGEAREAEASLRASILAAQAARDDTLVARATAILAFVILTWSDRPAEAREWAELSLATARRLGNPRASEARARSALASVALRDGRLDDAEREAQRTLILRTAVDGPESFTVGEALNTLGGIQRARGEHALAQVTFARALEIFYRHAGERHRSVAGIMNNLAGAMADAGDFARAAPLLRRALAIRERFEGPTHPRVAELLANLAFVLEQSGGRDEAVALRRRALAIHERALGPAHVRVARDCVQLGVALLELGRRAEAGTLAARALTLLDRDGENSLDLAAALHLSGRVALAGGDVARAVRLLERAVATASSPSAHGGEELGAECACSLASAYLAHGDRPRAVEAARRAATHPSGAACATAILARMPNAAAGSGFDQRRAEGRRGP